MLHIYWGNAATEAEPPPTPVPAPDVPAMTLNEAKYAALRDLTEEDSGTINSLEYAWLLSETSETGTLNELRITFLTQLGYTTGTHNERWFSFLGDLGYAGTLGERFYQYWTDYLENNMAVHELTVTATDFAALHTTTPTIVPSAGTGKVNVPIKITSYSSATGTAPTGANVTVRYGNETGEPASGNLTLTVGSVTFDATEEATEAVAEVAALPLVLSASGALTVAGAIVTTSIGAAGTLYEIDDVVTLGNATITINTVDVGGEVLTYTITTAGTSIVVGDDQAVTGGSGSGFEIDIDSVDVTANPYTLKVKVVYNVFDIT